jgi:hypothetical protein
MLDAAEFSTAVANAVPFLQEKADFITQRTHGDGVLELIDGLLQSIWQTRSVVSDGLSFSAMTSRAAHSSPPANFSMHCRSFRQRQVKR